MNYSLSKLRKIQLREIWEHEALDFTNWLALPSNLEELSREIGIDIKLIKTEANVGKYNVDILAEEEATGNKIIIENQLEDTDHDHLGKIITYASGYDAETIIWIVKDVRGEHQKAIEWLNEHTDENINFFLIKIELWQIEDSKPAPKFDIIVSPNEWAKTIKTSPHSGELTTTKISQLEFWTGFRNYVQNKDPRIRLQTPRPQHWYDVSMGSSDAHIALTVNTRENLLGCDIYISRNKDLFKYLKESAPLIEQELGQKLEWVDASVASRIKTSTKVNQIFDDSLLTPNYNWLYMQLIIFQKVFQKYIREFKNR